MAVDQDDLESQERAETHALEVIRAFMGAAKISQAELAAALGMTQTQVSRRLSVPGALSYIEAVKLARHWGVSVGTFDQPIADILDVSLGTVKSRITRGRESMRRQLEGRLEPEPALQWDAAAG